MVSIFLVDCKLIKSKQIEATLCVSATLLCLRNIDLTPRRTTKLSRRCSYCQGGAARLSNLRQRHVPSRKSHGCTNFARLHTTRKKRTQDPKPQQLRTCTYDLSHTCRDTARWRAYMHAMPCEWAPIGLYHTPPRWRRRGNLPCVAKVGRHPAPCSERRRHAHIGPNTRDRPRRLV